MKCFGMPVPALGLLLLSLGAGLLPAQDEPNNYPPKMVKRLRRLAGDNSKDCGVVGIAQSQVAANECALESFKKSAPFYVRFIYLNVDSESVVGYAGDAKGNVYEVEYWTSMIKGGGVGMSVHHCPMPVNFRVVNGRSLSCQD